MWDGPDRPFVRLLHRCPQRQGAWSSERNSPVPLEEVELPSHGQYTDVCRFSDHRLFCTRRCSVILWRRGNGVIPRASPLPNQLVYQYAQMHIAECHSRGRLVSRRVSAKTSLPEATLKRLCAVCPIVLRSAFIDTLQASEQFSTTRPLPRRDCSDRDSYHCGTRNLRRAISPSQRPFRLAALHV